MSDQLTLTAETRDRAGKGASRELRRNGRVPAVVYGGKEEPLTIHVEEKLLMKQLMTGQFFNTVVMIEVEGKTIRTLAKDVAFHPVKDRPIHADFLRISKNATVQVAVPVTFVNDETCVGVKRGGVLNIVRHELELIVDANNIPSEVLVDVADLEIGESLHISSVTLPEGTETVINDRDFTIVTVALPTTLDAEDEAETAEGEDKA